MSGGSDYWGFEEYPTGPQGPAGPPGPPGSAPTSVLAGAVSANRGVALGAGGLTQHDGTQASAEAIVGFCVTGGAAASTQTYYGSGSPAPVGITGWATGVRLWLKSNGDLDIKGNIASGTWTCPMGVYDGNTLAVNVGQSEYIP